MISSPSRKRETAAALLGLPLLGALVGCGAVSPSTSGNSATPGVQPGAVKPAPSTGYLWSSSDQTLRAIVGVPGASRLGPSLVPAGVYATASASPLTSSALLVDKAGDLFALQLPSGTALGISTGLPATARIRFAPSGSAATVFTPGNQSLLEVTGLPTAPASVAVSVPAGLADAVLGDSGSLLVATHGSGGTAIAVVIKGNTSSLTTVGSFGGFAFLPGTDDAVIVDNSAKTIALWHSVSASPTHLVIPSSLINDAVAVGASRDGRWALIANGSDTRLVRVDLSGASPATAASCLCQPSTVDPLAGNALFRISDANGAAPSPAWTADASAAQPRLLSIPALPAADGASASSALRATAPASAGASAPASAGAR